MNWFQRTLVKLASKIISKYKYHHIELESKLMVEDTICKITEMTIDHLNGEVEPKVEIECVPIFDYKEYVEVSNPYD